VQVERVLDGNAHVQALVSLRLDVGGRYDSFDASTDGKIADDGHPARLARGDEVVENLIGHGLVKHAAVAELDHVVLQ